MADLISIQLMQDDGVTPDTGAAPEFTYYGPRDGLSERAPPILAHRGFGVYVAEVPVLDATAGVVWLITTGSNPTRIAGSTSSSSDPLVAFMVETDDGELWPYSGGANDPAFVLYEAAGVPRAAPVIYRGTRVGVYAFTATAEDASANTVYAIAMPSGALPPMINDVVSAIGPVTFTAAQTGLFSVRLTLSKSIFDVPRVTNPANYAITPADATVLAPSIASVVLTTPNTVDLTLSLELVSGAYSVEVAGGAWNATDTLAQNVTTPVAFTATGDSPVVVSAYAPTLAAVRVIYSKRMRRVNPATLGDALRVANYGLSGRTITSVTALSDTQFELVLDAPMLVATTYTLTVSGSRDVAGGVVVPLSQTLPYGAAGETLAAPADAIGASYLVVPEWRLRSAFPTPTLETFRQRVLEACSASAYAGARGRAVLLRAQDSDLRAVFADLFQVTFSISASLVEARTASAVAATLDPLLTRLVPAALRELGQLGVMEAYLELLRVRLTSKDYRDRASAYAATVLLTATAVA